MSKHVVKFPIRHDGRSFAPGDAFEAEDSVIAPLIESGVLEAECVEAEEATPQVPPKEPVVKPPTKNELLASAKAEGLELEVTNKNTVAQINAAIKAAREAQPAAEAEAEKEVATEQE